MTLSEDIDAELTSDPWRRKATTIVRFELCSMCEYYSPQRPYKPGVRCYFNMRPDIIFEKNKSYAKCHVFIEKKLIGESR